MPQTLNERQLESRKLSKVRSQQLKVPVSEGNDLKLFRRQRFLAVMRPVQGVPLTSRSKSAGPSGIRTVENGRTSAELATLRAA